MVEFGDFTSHRSTITSWAEGYWLKSRIPGEYIEINPRFFEVSETEG